MKRILAVCFVFVAFSAFADDKFNITILDATVKNKVVSGVELTFQKDGASSVKATTDSTGKVNISNPLGVDDASVTMIARKDGYSSMVVTCPCDDFVYAISPTMRELDGMRIVLSWGAEPLDIDAHLLYADEHIFWDKKTGNDAHLDVDDTDGFGPETVTITKKHHGLKYVYAVHDFSAYDNGKPGNTNDLSKISSAKVFIYIGSTLIKTYEVPKTTPGTMWLPFYIDENGNIVDINEFSTGIARTSNSISKAMVEREVAKLLGNVSTTVASDDNTKKSKDKNAAGEKAYHAKNYNEAINLYWDAINLDPNNGQAYSNLGLAYQRTGNTAEAIWANRKAIDLANGANKNTIQASSYYNIARIYEAQEKWEDALQHYEWALEKRDHNAYKEGIARMKAKLK